MTKDEDFKLLKIQTIVLRVNIHCDGCKQKVKKLLQKIEGVYQVNVDYEQQKVTVSGTVDTATLIRKLVRAGKHAEIWSQKSTPNQKQQKASPFNKDDNKNNKGQQQKPNQVKGLESSLKNKQKFGLDEDHFDFDDDDDEFDDEKEMKLFREKLNHVSMLKQQIENANNKKGNGATSNGSSNNNSNGGKKGSPNQIQNMGMKSNPVNPQLGPNHGANDINTMMNLAGFNGNGGGIQPNNFFHGSEGFPVNGMATGHNPSSAMMMNMNGYHQYNNPMMNLQNRQPQMMYNRSPFVPPTTGYYYNYGGLPFNSHGYNGDHSAAHMFSDENTNSCSIM